MSDEQKQEGQLMPLVEARLTYCDTAFVDVSPTDEEFIFSVGSGGAIISRLVFSPKHLKRLKLLIDKKIAEYESRNEVIATSLPE